MRMRGGAAQVADMNVAPLSNERATMLLTERNRETCLWRAARYSATVRFRTMQSRNRRFSPVSLTKRAKIGASAECPRGPSFAPVLAPYAAHHRHLPAGSPV